MSSKQTSIRCYSIILVITILLVGFATPAGAIDASALDRTFSGGHWIWGIGIVFLLGLALNLTPCVYPMIPITVGYFGGQKQEKSSRKLLDACLFVLGMALIYTILGAMAGATGQVLGTALQHPVIQGFLALMMITMAAASFGMIDIRLPEPIRRESEDFGRRLGTFGMGMTLGVVAAPCLAPATVALLTYVGQTGGAVQGAGLFFVLSLGLGLPYVFLAVFSSSLHHLPGAGRWMDWVKKVLGYLMLGVAIYFSWSLIPTRSFAWLIIIWASLSGIDLMVTELPELWRDRLIRGGIVLLVASGIIYWTTMNLLLFESKLEWTSGKAFIQQKKPYDKPVFVYVSADWCVPCREMELTTFRDSEVKRTLARFQLVKLDITETPGITVGRWMERHDVQGVPTMIFLNRNGEEETSLRAEGYINGRQLLNRLQKLKR
ncbi:MAG: protein-disulfide reductase DsbD family protein [bacterium]